MWCENRSYRLPAWPSPPIWNSHRNSFENEAFSTKTSNPLKMQSLLKEFFGHCSYHNARTNSLPFSILKMLLTGSNCFHVISDCFDSFFGDLHAFGDWPPPEICQVCHRVKYYGKLGSFEKEFRLTKSIAVVRVRGQLPPQRKTFLMRVLRLFEKRSKIWRYGRSWNQI